MDNLPIVAGLTQDIVSLHAFINKPEVKAQIFRSYGVGLTWIDILKYYLPDRESIVSAQTMTSQDKNFFWETIHCGTVVHLPSGAGDFISFTLDGTLDIDSAGNFFPRERFILNLGTVNNPIRCWIPVGGIVSTGGTTPTVTITAYPGKSEMVTAAELYAGVEIPIGASAMGVQTGPTTSTVTGYNEYTHWAQLMKEAFLTGDMQMAQLHWAQKEGIGWWIEETAETEMKLDFQKADAALWGQEFTNAAILDVSTAPSALGKTIPVYANKGLWSWGQDYGYHLNYDSGTGLTVDDFNQVCEYYISKGIISQTGMFLQGIQLNLQLETALKDYIKGTTGSLTETFTPKSGDYTHNLEIGFRHLYKGGLMFPMHVAPEFNHPMFMGATVTNAKKSGIIIPISMAMDNQLGPVPNVSVKYVGLGNYKREKIVNIYGGMGGFAKQALGVPYAQHKDDYTDIHWLTQPMYPVYEPWRLVTVTENI